MIRLKENVVGIGTIDINKFTLSNVYDENEVKKALRTALISAGLGVSNTEHPLMDIISKGDNVLIKPNWVLHYNFNPLEDTKSLITNHALIEAVLDYLEACQPNKVIIGDAPIQGCNLKKIANQEWMEKLSQKHSYAIEFIDFRQTIMEYGESKIPITYNNKNRNQNDFVLFDLGESSSLEEISSRSNFRVAMYDHRELNEVHKKGKHLYLIAKELFETDVIINLPKLKTHKKAGMTGALKNLVGINGSKNYLPHHRLGSPKCGGDNYPDYSIFKSISEYLIDIANINIGKKSYKHYKKVGDYFASISNKIGVFSDMEGGWYGNDTTWRMVMDLNKIILYGKKDGELSRAPLRRIYSITDAIIGGDTEGPLSVKPVLLGMITFASSSAFADLVHAHIMNFDWQKIPCIKEAFLIKEHPIVQHGPEECQVYINGNESNLKSIAERHGKPFVPSKYWCNYIEMK